LVLCCLQKEHPTSVPNPRSWKAIPKSQHRTTCQMFWIRTSLVYECYLQIIVVHMYCKPKHVQCIFKFLHWNVHNFKDAKQIFLICTYFNHPIYIYSWHSILVPYINLNF
jgi:hypothetical protein